MFSSHRLIRLAVPGATLLVALLVVTLAGCSGSTGAPTAVALASENAPAEPQPPAAVDPQPAAAEPAAAPEVASDPQPAATEPAAAPPAEPKKDAPLDDADPAALEQNDNTKKPFRVAVPIADFPRDMTWLNTSGPLRKQDLKGKFVLLDFWTYCCINCIHILPELKKLEKAYPNNLVVIGVHSAKFEGEKNTKNIEEAILRYEIEHPVVNDADHQIWESLGVNSWPTIMMIDPEGFAVWGRSGEFKFEEVDGILKGALPYYRGKKLLDEKPMRFDLLASRQKPTQLRFPGKVVADEKSGRLFIADSNNNRIVVASLDGKLIATIGSGAIGKADGGFAAATFNHPQGMALHGETLYVADTENHMLRKVDLEKKTVVTISGNGEQARSWPGLDARGRGALPRRFVAPPKKTELNSPWDLWVHGDDLYIAMAGPHQIWKMPLDESEIGLFAGNGREDIVDGPHLPKTPYEQGISSFAQPSGLSSDGVSLFVADSEGSSIRAVPFSLKQEVRTVVGTNELQYGRLFRFGDKDGKRDDVLLQHALGVAYADGKIYVADTYNNKIKVVDAETGDTRSLAGVGKPGASDDEPSFDEPAGISIAGGKLYVADTNNHLIRVVDAKTGKTSTLEIQGLAPLGAVASAAGEPKAVKKPNFANAHQVKPQMPTLKPKDGAVRLKVSLQLPPGWKVNPQAPMSYYLDAVAPKGPVDRTKLGKFALKQPVAEFDAVVPVVGAGDDVVTVSLNYFYCQDKDDGVCKFGSVVFTVPLKLAADAKSSEAGLSFAIPE